MTRYTCCQASEYSRFLTLALAVSSTVLQFLLEEIWILYDFLHLGHYRDPSKADIQFLGQETVI